MNAQNPAEQAKQDEAKKAAEAKAAEARKAAEVKAKADAEQAKDDAETNATSELETDEGAKAELVTLVHEDHDAVVEVAKPSADYTNYVRSYGYQEKGSK